MGTLSAGNGAAIANVEMAKAWDGEEGDDWTENADRYEATDRWLFARFEAAVDVAPGDEILDVGCGTGSSTRSFARRAGRGRVVGIDLSSRMLDHARRKSAAEGVDNVEYIHGDAQVHPFEAERFDLTISVFGAMFFDAPRAAFTNIRRGMPPGGRLAMLSWQRFEENEWLTTIFGVLADGRDLPTPPSGRPGPFGLADRGDVESVVADAGFGDVRLTSLREPMWLGADEADAWAFVSTMGIVRGLTDGLHPDRRERVLSRLRGVLADREGDLGVTLGSAAWLITACAA